MRTARNLNRFGQRGEGRRDAPLCHAIAISKRRSAVDVNDCRLRGVSVGQQRLRDGHGGDGTRHRDQGSRGEANVQRERVSRLQDRNVNLVRDEATTRRHCARKHDMSAASGGSGKTMGLEG